MGVGSLRIMEMEPFQVEEKTKRKHTWGGIVAVQSGVQLTRTKMFGENSLQ